MQRQVWGAVVLSTLIAAGARATEGQDGQLLRASRFQTEAGVQVLDAWKPWQPICADAACRVQVTSEGLLVDAPENDYAVGGVTQQVGPVKPGQWYALDATCQLRGIKTPLRSAVVRITWFSGKKMVHPAGTMARGPVADGDTARFHDVVLAPEKADSALVSLEVKWPQGGSVLWREVTLRPGSPPSPRTARIGTVYMVPRKSSPQKNLDLWCEKIDAAGQLKLDAVCLCEAITMVGTGLKAQQCAEPIPGPASQRLAAAAAKNHLWVVAGLYERAEGHVFNTAVLLDRQGKLAGTYRKTHLPREEWKDGVRPASDYPVFKTDFGTVAIQICYDWFFPQPAEIFSLRGAEVLFAPTWGNTLPDEDGRVDGETTFRVRARDNGLYLVPSVYSGNSMVIDPMGRILASSKGQEGVVWAEIDLNRREALSYVGRWRDIGPRDRMPDTYQPLLESPASR